MSTVFQDLQETKRILRLYALNLKDGGLLAKKTLVALRCEWPSYLKTSDGTLYDSERESCDRERKHHANSRDCVRPGGDSTTQGGGNKPSHESSDSSDEEGSAQGSGAVLDLGASLQRVWTEPRAIQEIGSTVQLPEDPGREEDRPHQEE